MTYPCPTGANAYRVRSVHGGTKAPPYNRAVAHRGAPPSRPKAYHIATRYITFAKQIYHLPVWANITPCLQGIFPRPTVLMRSPKFATQTFRMLCIPIPITREGLSITREGLSITREGINISRVSRFWDTLVCSQVFLSDIVWIKVRVVRPYLI